MTRWTYRARTFLASKDDDIPKAYIAREYPNYRPRKHDILSLEAHLNHWGDNGWELVHIEPFDRLGSNDDLGYSYPDTVTTASWRKNYFCVFRKPVDA